MPEDSLSESIRSLMTSLVGTGGERGLQVAAYLDGELILDLAAGDIDATSGRAVTTETLFPVYSVTKGIAATISHILAERGIVSYDKPIADVWPEFGCHGKEAITLRQALNHSAGLPCMPAGIDISSLQSWDLMCEKIAGLTPVWEPGTRIDYHPVTFGWIVGETLSRADGRTFPELLRDEICTPLDISDLHIGIPGECDGIIATVEEDRSVFPHATRSPSDQPEPIPWWLFPLDELMNRPEARRACIPATSGIMTARAIARHYAATLPGGVDGITLFPLSRLQLATTPQYPEPVPLGYVPTKSLGYQTGFASAAFPRPEAFGHGGHGGSTGFADPVTGLAVGIAKNILNSKSTAEAIVTAICQGLAGEF